MAHPLLSVGQGRLSSAPMSPRVRVSWPRLAWSGAVEGLAEQAGVFPVRFLPAEASEKAATAARPKVSLLFQSHLPAPSLFFVLQARLALTISDLMSPPTVLGVLEDVQTPTPLSALPGPFPTGHPQSTQAQKETSTQYCGFRALDLDQPLSLCPTSSTTARSVALQSPEMEGL